MAQFSAGAAPLSLEDAYKIQTMVIQRRIARGEKLVGLKMGFTSRAKMVQMGVHDLIWGQLTDSMIVEEGGDVSRRHLVAGRTPGRLLEELFDTTREPDEPMDWRAALAMFVARARAPVHTWSRPSRRFPTRIFEVPGRSWAPRRRTSYGTASPASQLVDQQPRQPGTFCRTGGSDCAPCTATRLRPCCLAA